MRQCDLKVDPGFLDDRIPTLDPTGGIFHVIVAQAHVDSRKRWDSFLQDLAICKAAHGVLRTLQSMVIIQFDFLVASLDAGIKGVGGIG